MMKNEKKYWGMIKGYLDKILMSKDVEEIHGIVNDLVKYYEKEEMEDDDMDYGEKIQHGLQIVIKEKGGNSNEY